MHCPDCDVEIVTFSVPETYEECLPGGTDSTAAVGLCPRCLSLEPVSSPPSKNPDFERLGESFPSNADAAVPMALLVGLLSNLALYRSEITTLLEAVERTGTDPLLVLDRLDRDPNIQSDIDLAGRRRQLEQLY